jgi:hypothetical protein
MIVGLMSAVSAFFFWKLPSDAGEQLSRRAPPT